jgi:hypothetical protein
MIPLESGFMGEPGSRFREPRPLLRRMPPWGWTMKRLLLACVGLGFCTLAAAGAKGDAKIVLDCMRANVVERGALRHLQVVTTDKSGGATTLEMDLYWRPSATGSTFSIQVTQPDTLAGAAYLLRENQQGPDDLYIYVPTIGKARRILGAARGENLWGTSFSYDEIKLAQGLVQTGPTTRLADSTVRGRTVFVLESTFGEPDVPSRRSLTYVDQKSCTVLRSELFSEAGTLAKTLDGDLSLLFQTSDHDDKPIWLMLGYTMKDVATGTRSVVRLGEIHLLEKARASLFAPESFFQPLVADDH